MFEKLQRKWKVTGWRLLLILITFAVGGSLCGYTGRKLMGITGIDQGPVWVIIYIVTVIILWPLCAILVSIPLGQFVFFKKYIKKVFRRMSGKKPEDEKPLTAADDKNNINIAILASGTGSNAEKLLKQLPELLKNGANISVIITDNPNAGVLNVAAENNVDAEVLVLRAKTEKEKADTYLSLLNKHKVNFIILAGYLKKIPDAVIKAFPRRIINIHPALLPAYGGAGMYGRHVHSAVLQAGEKESGITIHYADEVYDNGEVIFQARCKIDAAETAESLAKKVLALEHEHYSRVAADVLQSQNRS